MRIAAYGCSVRVPDYEVLDMPVVSLGLYPLRQQTASKAERFQSLLVQLLDIVKLQVVP